MTVTVGPDTAHLNTTEWSTGSAIRVAAPGMPRNWAVDGRPMFTTGLVLAAGQSSRLGQPKQLLQYRGRTLLDNTLDVARSCDFDQLIVALGGAGDEVKQHVDLSGCEIVDNVHFTTGCSSSIVAALDVVDERADGLVLLLGDQPDVDAVASVDALLTGRRTDAASIAVCLYDNGRGTSVLVVRLDIRGAGGSAR